MLCCWLACGKAKVDHEILAINGRSERDVFAFNTFKTDISCLVQRKYLAHNNVQVFRLCQGRAEYDCSGCRTDQVLNSHGGSSPGVLFCWCVTKCNVWLSLIIANTVAYCARLGLPFSIVCSLHTFKRYVPRTGAPLTLRYLLS